MTNPMSNQNNNGGDGGSFARQQQQDPATQELLQRLAYQAQARNEQMMHQRQQQTQQAQQAHQQQPYQPMMAQQPQATTTAYQPQSQATTPPPQPRTRKAKRRRRNNTNKGAAAALNANYNNYPTGGTGATNQNQNNGNGSAGAANAVPPAPPNEPALPQIPPGYFMPQAPRTFKERWEQLKIAFGAKSNQQGNNPYNDYNSLLKAQKPMKILKGVSIGTNFGGAFFAIACSIATWFYGASSSVDWLREQPWGKFVDGDFWNVAIWPILLLATFYIIACTPLSWPEGADEWIGDTIWGIIFAIDVVTNIHRINQWLPTFVLPGSNETIKWTWLIPVLVVLFSVMISYFPERVFWAQVQRLGQLRIQLAYQKLVKEYLKYQEGVRLQLAYQKLVSTGGQQMQPGAGGAAAPTPNRYHQ